VLAGLIRDTRIGTRHERQEKEAELEGEAVIADEEEEEDDEDEEEEEDKGAREIIAHEERSMIGQAWLEENRDDIGALDVRRSRI
jgi:hypothetical protein